jgi:phosphatidylinositol-4,5-bisphosphate 4-phosphatase
MNTRIQNERDSHEGEQLSGEAKLPARDLDFASEGIHENLFEVSRTNAAAFAFKQLWFDTAKAYLTERLLSNDRGALLKRSLEEERGAMDRNRKLFTEDTLGEKGDILRRLAEQISSNASISVEEAEKGLKRQFVKQLDEASWQSIYQRLNSDQILPSSEFLNATYPLNEEISRRFDGADSFRKDGIAGRSSGSLKGSLKDSVHQHHMPNGWFTELTIDGQKNLFQAFRTATLVQYGEKVELERNKNTQHNVRKLLHVMALKELEDLSYDDRQRVLSQERTLSLKILSLDLQTWVPVSPEKNKFDVERQTIEEQRTAFEAHRGHQKFLFEKGNGESNPFDVEVEILALNFPVHEQSFQSGLGFGEEVTKRNEAPFLRLLELTKGKAEKLWEDGGQDSQQQACKILYLVDEVRELFEGGEFRNPGVDPYALNSRLANLAYLSGITVHYNCRSGKDRTGFLDGEAKLLAIKLEGAMRGETQTSLSYATPLSCPESRMLFEFLVEGGGAEIQTLNSGVPGSKLKPILKGELSHDPLVQRVGRDRWMNFKGLSKYADT